MFIVYISAARVQSLGGCATLDIVDMKRIAILFWSTIGLAFCVVSGVTAQETIRPAVVLAVYDDAGDDQSGDSEARRLVTTAIEGRLRADLRYRLSRRSFSEDPERFLAGLESGQDGPAVVLIRLAPRRDGTYRVELDIWRSGEYRWSTEEDLPGGDNRFLIADALAAELSRELGALYPGFGRVRFTNTGADADFYVFADGTYLGANLPAIELPIGSYDFEIRRREDEFEHVIGRSTIELERDGLYELRFALGERPPVVPAILRLTDPRDRWKLLFDVSSFYGVPTFEIAQDNEVVSVLGLATVLLNDVLLRNHVVGFQAGFLGSWYNEDSLSSELFLTPVMVTTGFSIGPVAGVDLVFHFGGGVAATGSDFVYTDIDGIEQRFEGRGFAPAYVGTMQFGFGVYDPLRLSLTTSGFGVVEDGRAYTWIAVGLGVGARF